MLSLLICTPSCGEPSGDSGSPPAGRHEDSQEHLHPPPGPLRPPLRRHHPLHPHRRPQLDLGQLHPRLQVGTLFFLIFRSCISMVNFFTSFLSLFSMFFSYESMKKNIKNLYLPTLKKKLWDAFYCSIFLYSFHCHCKIS